MQHDETNNEWFGTMLILLRPGDAKELGGE